MISLNSITKLMTLAVLPCQMGCAVVDQYSGRAVAYNVEAEQAQDQALLLNVVRAYLRRPMQFTSVSTITGSASATGGVQYTAPVNVPFRPVTNGSSIAAFPPLNTWTVNAGMSGGPTFTVPVLDTQEFYDGIMRPISGQLYDLYNQGEYPRSLLFALFVQKVVMTLDNDECLGRGQNGQKPAKTTTKSKPVKAQPTKAKTDPVHPSSDCEFIFHNSVENDLELDLFQALADYLMYLGFSTESTPGKTDNYFEGTTNQSRIRGLEIKFNGPSPFGGDSSQAGSSSPGGGGSKDYGFCFSPTTSEAASDVPDTAYWCKNVRLSGDNIDQPTEAKRQELIKPTGSATGRIRASDNFVRRLVQIAQDNRTNPELVQQLSEFAGKKVYLSFTLRSVEALVYFLGEIARRELAPEYGETPRVILVRSLPRYAIPPAYQSCTVASDFCEPVFVLERNAVPGPSDFLWVDYELSRYSVPGGKRGGVSSAVLEIVKQLLALNSSAKSLPASNVISLVGQ